MVFVSRTLRVESEGRKMDKASVTKEQRQAVLELARERAAGNGWLSWGDICDAAGIDERKPLSEVVGFADYRLWGESVPADRTAAVELYNWSCRAMRLIAIPGEEWRWKAKAHRSGR